MKDDCGINKKIIIDYCFQMDDENTFNTIINITTYSRIYSFNINNKKQVKQLVNRIHGMYIERFLTNNHEFVLYQLENCLSSIQSNLIIKKLSRKRFNKSVRQIKYYLKRRYNLSLMLF